MLQLKLTLILLYVVLVFGEGPSVKLADTSRNTVNVAAVETTKAPTVEETANQTTTEASIPITNATTPAPSTPSTVPTPTPPFKTASSTPSPTPTTAPPTPTPTTAPPTPTTTEAPKHDYWEVVGENGTVCILAKMDIKLDLKPNEHSKDVAIIVPKEAKANGTCGENQQTLVLFWDKNKMVMFFKSNETLEKYYLDSVAVEIKADNNTFKLREENITMFETSMNHSYLCSYSDPLKVRQNNETIQFSFTNIKLEAFKHDNSTSFSNAYACPSDTPDIVPIVVGCALTVLVVVVLIAYLVSRRRTQARGYLSM